MNLELLESFGKTYPEDNDGTLDCGSVALTCAFNRYGTLLAVGCNDGRIAVWDLMTRCMSKSFSGHVQPITSMCWTRDGHQLASGSTDFNVCLWDVLSGDIISRHRFPSAPLKLQCHPRKKTLLLVCLMKQAPVLMDLEAQTQHVLPTDGASEQNIVASFGRNGEHIFTGSARGKILVINSESLQVVKSFRVLTSGNTSTPIKSIEHSHRGSLFLLNCADRVIRVYDANMLLDDAMDMDEPECLLKIQDQVNRTVWKKCCFSGDNEYVVAGCSRQHVLNIWETSTGKLVKILQGLAGEVLLDVAWHPIRPIVASISSGVVTIWSHNQVENWSAFAPDFKELEENEEYEERESEFDVEDDDKSVNAPEPEKEEEDTLVDVTTVDVIPAFCYSDDDEEGNGQQGLLFIPITPEIDEPEESGWGQLEPPVMEAGHKRPLSPDNVATSAKKLKL